SACQRLYLFLMGLSLSESLLSLVSIPTNYLRQPPRSPHVPTVAGIVVNYFKFKKLEAYSRKNKRDRVRGNLLKELYHNKTPLYGKLSGISLSVVLAASILSAASLASPASPAEAFTGNCAYIAVKNFKGAVFEDPILAKRERATPGTVQTAYVTETLSYFKLHGFNTVRVAYFWESYVNNPSVFMQELDLIAKTAQAKGMCVVFANFHYYTSSYWGTQWNGWAYGRGFPSFVVKNFPVVNDDYKATAGPFWNAFLSNNILISGAKVWDVQFGFLSKVINKVKGYNSTAGFEIINEPHLFNKAMYDKLGNYHTYMAKKMRSITDKKIFFDRETAWGFVRDPTLEYKIVPQGVSRLVYTAQLYAVPTIGSQGMQQLERFKTWSQQWGTEVFICEWGADNQSEATTFLKAFKGKNFGWTYYAWKKAANVNALGGALYDSDTTAPTQDLLDLKAAMNTVY
ncbi:MAG: cellulase family glycosylhydrolase, partial [Nitrososphaera sp.]